MLGFVHSAFSFAHESLLGRSITRIADKNIPPGALISFLQKGLQYVAIEESLQREGTDVSTKAKAKEAANGDSSDFTLLSPATIQALTRENPPIQLSVPPATAAAAVKARLEVEARLQADKKEIAATAISVQSPVEHTTISTASTRPGHQAPETHNTLAMPTKKALAAQAVITQAATVSAITQLQQQSGSAPSSHSSTVYPRLTEVAHVTVFQQQQHQEYNLQKSAARQEEVSYQQSTPGTALAIVASQQGLSRKGKSGGRKGKLHQGNGSGGTSSTGSTVALHLQQQAQHQPQTSSAFASLEEAVARLEAKRAKGVSNSSKAEVIPMDVDTVHHVPVGHIHAGVGMIRSSGHDQVNGQSKEQNGSIEGVHDRPTIGSGTPQIHASAQAQEVVSNKGEADATIEREDEVTRVHPSEVLALNKHASEVFMCAWNPIYTDLIATGSGDASARIWQMGGPDASSGCGPVRLLPHGTDPNDRKNKDVTTLEWSSDGKLLATGSYDGVARVWSRNGALVHTLAGHRGPIFSLKWNRSGNFLLSGSYDQTTIVWDVSMPNGHVVQQFSDHEAPALDVDWKDDTTFASCSTDKRVLICRVGVEKPLRIYTGHIDEVNAVKWDPSGTLLASCSDDYTAKVWNVTTDQTEPMYDFKSHKAEIYTVKWYVGSSSTSIISAYCKKLTSHFS